MMIRGQIWSPFGIDRDLWRDQIQNPFGFSGTKCEILSISAKSNFWFWWPTNRTDSEFDLVCWNWKEPNLVPAELKGLRILSSSRQKLRRLRRLKRPIPKSWNDSKFKILSKFGPGSSIQNPTKGILIYTPRRLIDGGGHLGSLANQCCLASACSHFQACDSTMSQSNQ